MIKRILIFMLTAVLFSTALMAQEADSVPPMLLTGDTLPAVESLPAEPAPYYMQKRHTLQLSVGYISAFYYCKLLFAWIPAAAQHAHNWHFYGNYGLQYYYQMNSWCRIGGKVNWEMDGYDVYSSNKADGVRIGRTTNNTASLVFSAQFTYLNRPKVQLYSGADIGAAMHNMHTRYDDKSKPTEDQAYGLFAFNITPLGVAFGSWPVYGYVESNFGYDALIKAGLGVHF